MTMHLDQIDIISMTGDFGFFSNFMIFSSVAMETAFYRNAQGAHGGTRRIRILDFLYM